MLASPAETLDEALDQLGHDVLVDFKLDGARIQVHRNGDEVRVFTRSLREITSDVPEIIAHALALRGRAFVLDGESLAVTDEGRPRTFQESRSRSTAGVQQPHYFDVLHLDGEDLMDAPLEQRLAALRRLAPEHHIRGEVRPGRDRAAELLAEALDAGHEGVMVKALSSPYASGRRGKAWLKVKPAHTLDLVVLAAEWGYGRRTGWLSNIHLGARDPDGGPPVMVGKTFKGMTDELLAWQTATFPGYATGNEGQVVHLRPELVVEIELDGVQTSSRYPGGVALRFSRVLRYRPDKTAAVADTIATVRSFLGPG